MSDEQREIKVKVDGKTAFMIFFVIFLIGMVIGKLFWCHCS